MKKVIKKHPLAIRWFHWINFPVLAIMVWSGLLIYWANDVYKVGWSNKAILKFFPDSFYKAFHIPFRLAEGMSLHFVFMWFFAINGFIYVLYLLFSGEWKLIFPNKKSFKESLQVVLHDLHIRKTIPPQKKYNAAQRIAYTVVIFMGVGSLLSGLAIYKPVQFHLLTAMLGGYEWARAEHFILTILFSLFFLVHIVQVVLAGWNNFRSMVTGLDVLPQENLSNIKLASAGSSLPGNLMIPLEFQQISPTDEKTVESNEPFKEVTADIKPVIDNKIDLNKENEPEDNKIAVTPNAKDTETKSNEL